MDSADGRIAVGWLIVEDLAMVLALVLLPAIAAPAGGYGTSGRARLAGAGHRADSGQGRRVRRVHARDRAPRGAVAAGAGGPRSAPASSSRSGILAVALGIAVGAAALFGVSFALGAFFAGVVISESDLSHRVASDALPLQDAFAVLFFVSVGMLLDPAVLVQRPLQVLLVLLIIVVGKSVAAFGIVLAFRHPVRTALTISASLAQIGEFSFILVALGISLHLLPVEARNLVLAGAILSITLNPFIFSTIEPLGPLAQRPPSAPRRARAAPDAPCPLDPPSRSSPHSRITRSSSVTAGSGEPSAMRWRRPGSRRRSWSRIASTSRRSGGEGSSRSSAMPPGQGSWRMPRSPTARLLVVAAPNPFEARQIIALARGLNPEIDIVVRTHSAAEQTYLDGLNVGRAFMGERELALAMARYALRALGRRDEEADRIVDELRTIVPGEA